MKVDGVSCNSLDPNLKPTYLIQYAARRAVAARRRDDDRGRDGRGGGREEERGRDDVRSGGRETSSRSASVAPVGGLLPSPPTLSPLTNLTSD